MLTLIWHKKMTRRIWTLGKTCETRESESASEDGLFVQYICSCAVLNIWPLNCVERYWAATARHGFRFSFLQLLAESDGSQNQFRCIDFVGPSVMKLDSVTHSFYAQPNLAAWHSPESVSGIPETAKKFMRFEDSFSWRSWDADGGQGCISW